MGRLALGGAALFLPVGGGSVQAPSGSGGEGYPRPGPLEPSGPVPGPLRLLFVHHSCGGRLLADPGEPEDGEHCIHGVHPDGGGLRRLLVARGYEVHEASYGSELGEHTDLFDWLPKFRDRMDRILTCDRQDASYRDGGRNRIVVFKSCFPNNAFVAEGFEPGNPAGPELTVANARAVLRALLEPFSRRPDTLFVYVTAPPLAPAVPDVPAWKWIAATILGRSPAGRLRESARLAREFHRWAVAPDGWLAGYPGRNVVVFDLYDVLTDRGASDLSAFPTGNGADSHPSREGNRRAAEAFVPFLDRAVRQAGLVP